MRTHLLLFLLSIIIISSCKDQTAITENLQLKELKDSLIASRKIIDSLENTNASLFDKAIQLEKDSANKAIFIYQQIANKYLDKTNASYERRPYYVKQALDRINYLQALQFLDYIRIDGANNMMVDDYHRNFKIANVDSFMTYISKRRFEIYDANNIGNENTKYSYEELRKQLIARKGQAYEVITQMSYIYSIPYPQYSQCDFAVSTDGMTGIYIKFAGNYRLSFQFDGKNMPYKLAKIESYHIDDL